MVKVDYSAADQNDSAAVMKTATMSGANSKPLHAAQAIRIDLITSLDADGFTVSNQLNVNALNSCGAGSDPCEYHWVAWKGGTDIQLGTYTGNGTTQSITGVGFSPDYLIVMGETNRRAVHRNSLIGNVSLRFGAGGRLTDGITSLDADGFSVQNSSSLFDNPNESGVTYHYAAWNEVAGQIKVGVYPGDGNDDKDISGVGFQPEFVIVQNYDDDRDARMKSDTMTIGASPDAAMNFRAGLAGNVIQDLITDGFQVGSDNTVNDPIFNYYYVAFNVGEFATAVELVSFTATGLNGEVLLEWETGSELENLGFHLYRSLSEEGPYEQITASVIPGLGSSPAGAKYSYVDSGLTNGVTYYYKLEDIETTGATELHGPVSATPEAGLPAGDNQGGEEGSGENSGDSTARIVFGDPGANQVKVRRHDRRGVEIELITEGFYAYPEGDGTVRLEVPDFVEDEASVGPDIPVYRTWLAAMAGRQVKLVSVQTEDIQTFASLQPSFSEAAVITSPNGVVRAGRRKPSSPQGHARRESGVGQGFYPEEWARIVSVGFQGDVKKALVELAPLRWDTGSGGLVLARRLVVRLSFVGRGRGHQERENHRSRSVMTRLALSEPGLYGVSFESVYGKRRRLVATSALRLSRQGEPVAFHVEPKRERFGPGSVLYFVSEGASLNPYGQEVVYELERSGEGKPMEELSGAPSGTVLSYYWKTLAREENLLYQAALIEAEDIWQWDWLLGPMTKSFPFTVTNLSSVPEASRLEVWLQGASDFPESPDHHVRVYVNGTLIAEQWWDGERGVHLVGALGPGLLHEGENMLEIEDAGDTEAAYSMVMLDRFDVSYPAQLAAEPTRSRGVDGG
jgi:hypothetical protein